MLLVIWNSLGREVQQYVHIPVPSGDYLVTGPKSEQLHCDVIPLAKSVYDIPGRSSNSTHELVFHVTLPPMNYATYGISRKLPSTSLLNCWLLFVIPFQNFMRKNCDFNGFVRNLAVLGIICISAIQRNVRKYGYNG